MSPDDYIKQVGPGWKLVPSSDGGPQNELRTMPDDPRRSMSMISLMPNNAGIRVTHETAMMVSAVWACIDAISKAIATSHWNIYELLRNGDRDLRAEDPLSYLLNVRPNPDMTAVSFRRALIIAGLSWGNGYAEIVRDRANRVVELWPLHPWRVVPRRSEVDGSLYFDIANPNGQQTVLPGADVLHIRGPGIYGLWGDDPIAKAARTIALAIAQERFAEAYYGNNAQLGGIIEYPGQIDEPTFDRLQTQWNSRHQGSGRAFRVGFIEGGVKYHEIGVDASKAQGVESRQHQIEEICRWYGVPPHKIQHLLRATFSNIEHLGIEFVRDGLRPWAMELQQEADFKLFSQRGATRFSILDLEWASQGDFLSRAQGYQIMRNIGAYSANDILRREGQNTIGAEGDIRIVNSASVRLEDVGKVAAPGSGSAPRPPGAPEEPPPGEEQVPESTRQAYVASFAAIFDRAARRHRARVEDLRANASDFEAALEEFNVEQVKLIAKELFHPCAAFSALVGEETSAESLRWAKQVLGGRDHYSAALELVDSFLRNRQ